MATFSAASPRDVERDLATPRFDIEGRVIRTRHQDLTLFNVYFPNGQRGQARVDYKLDFYARLLEVCEALLAAGENVIITGDFNTAHMPMDLSGGISNELVPAWIQSAV